MRKDIQKNGKPLLYDLHLLQWNLSLYGETPALDAAAKAEPPFLVPCSSAECPARCATEARYVSRTPALLHVPEHYINSFNHGLLLSKDYLVIIGWHPKNVRVCRRCWLYRDTSRDLVSSCSQPALQE